MFKDFVTLFTGMKAATGIMLIVGLILIIVKIFQPGQRTFGYLGGIFIVLGVVFRMINDGSSSHLFWLTFMVITILFISYIVSVATNRSGWFVKMKEEDEKMLATSLANRSKFDMTMLTNRKCEAVTEFFPEGTIKLDGNYYVAISAENEFIPKNSKLIIANVDGNKLYVKKLKEEKQC